MKIMKTIMLCKNLVIETGVSHYQSQGPRHNIKIETKTENQLSLDDHELNSKFPNSGRTRHFLFAWTCMPFHGNKNGIGNLKICTMNFNLIWEGLQISSQLHNLPNYK